MSVFGVWMWPQSIRDHGAKQVAMRCALSGVTDIYFLTKGLGGTLSCRSALVPHLCGRDLLGELLSAAHPLGIRVHAWLTSASDEHYKQQHPLSGRCHYTRGRDKGLIALTDEGYLLYMESIVRELCCSYDIDGLHLDYIRYNHLLYGWSEEDQARYKAAGADPARLRHLMDQTFLAGNDGACIFDAYRSGDPSAAALARVRLADVLRFAQRLTACARAERQDLILSAALMPEGAYEDTAFSDLHYGQCYLDAARLYNYVLPMAYSSAYGKDSRWVRAVADGSVKKGCPTVVGLHAYEGATGDSLREDIAILSGAAIEGVCLFREGAFVTAFSEGKKLRLFNPLSRPITDLLCGAQESAASLSPVILPGEEHTVLLPAAPDRLRVFAGDDEVCVHLTRLA